LDNEPYGDLEADVKIRPLSLSKKSISGNDYIFMP
jgi:hypothetical protein